MNLEYENYSIEELVEVYVDLVKKCNETEKLKAGGFAREDINQYLERVREKKFAVIDQFNKRKLTEEDLLKYEKYKEIS